MAYKQPRVPPMKDGRLTEYIRELVLFLKDFSLETWTAVTQLQKQLSQDKGDEPDDQKGESVTSVNGKTGEVELSAEDVGALGKNEQAADSAKLGGKTPEELMLTMYPVGSIYTSLDSASPASIFGGTWEQLKDRFLLGAGDSYEIGSAGGEAAHTLTESEMPSHYHSLYLSGMGGSTTTPAYFAAFKASAYDYKYENGVSGTHRVASAANKGDSAAHNNMPPYLAVYMWKRVS